MKIQKLFSFILLVGAVAFASCDRIPEGPDGPGGGKDTIPENPGDTTQNPGGEDTFDWSVVALPDGATLTTVAEAREIASKLASDGSETTSETYYVRGIVKKFASKHESGMTEFGNATFYMVDKDGDTDDFEAYQVYNINKEKYTSLDQIALGDRVVVCCHITNYNGTYETAGKGDGYVYWSNNPAATAKDTVETPGDVVGDGTQANPFSIADVLLMNNTKSGTYFVKGILVGQVAGNATALSASTAEFKAPFTANDNNTNTNILLADAATTNVDDVIPVQLPSGFLREGLNLIAHPENLGKEVIVYGSTEKYFGKAGVKNISRAFIDGKEIVLEVGEAPAATPVTVAQFIAAPVNSTVPGVWYELTGRIVDNSANGNKFDLTTYGNFDLADATGQVYVYGLNNSYLPLSSATKANSDKNCAALNLAAGDSITLRGVRAEYNGKIQVLGGYFVQKH